MPDFATVLNTLQKNIRRAQVLFGPPSPWAETSDDMLKSELLSAEQMGQYGRTLAEKHKLAERQGPDSLLARLDENEVIINSAYQALVQAVEKNQQITPAGEWMLDNFYLIEDHIQIARRHLPRGYSRGLPRLSKGPSDSLPRVYDIALQIISHSDARLNAEVIQLFISSYQKFAPLKLGELWAVPIMLRLALIENLRRVSVRLSRACVSRDLADHWATQMAASVESDPTGLILVIADMARSSQDLESVFVAELTRRLQGQGAALALPLTWMEQRLSQIGTTTEQVIFNETRQQASDQVSISNSIGSLRFLSKMNWRQFVEDLSLVDQVLATDPANTYSLMDFASRDLYRHSIEKIAKYSTLSEEDIARHAVQLAAAVDVTDANDPRQRQRHVGYYLVDKGLPALESIAQIKISVLEKIRRAASDNPLHVYLGAVTFMTVYIACSFTERAYHHGMHPVILGLFALACLLGASHFSLGIVNWLATMLARPDHRPRLDFSKGISDEARTVVAVPTMITSHAGIDDLTEGLEVRFLANRGKNLTFCLLTDFGDADTETLPQDVSLLDHAERNIEALNNKYAGKDQDVFFLLHRPRLWNAQEAKWMAYERKRGKLGALNELLRTGDDKAFMRIVGRHAAMVGSRYVITLDTDTQLPRDAAHQFIGVMAHPLNRAHYDENLGRVTEGYGLMQPRVAATLPDVDASIYAQLCGGEPGIDPYTRAVSDLYQDAFHEGSFVGKGIYEVEAFERGLKNRFPENRILSHDLIEGCYVRSGLLSDVQLYEEYPSRYSADVSRRHRWTRGDWQIARWMLPNVPVGDGSYVRNPLSALSRWKIFDNLRRSLVPLALLCILVLGWAFTTSPSYWSLAVGGILLIPSLSSSILGFCRKSPDANWRQHFTDAAYSTGRNLGNAGLMLLCLPYEAYYYTDAICRVLWRMLVTRKLLLEWNPSSNTNRSKAESTIPQAYRALWVCPAFALALAVVLLAANMHGLAVAVPFLALWCVFPAAVWRLSQPVHMRKPHLTDDQRQYLGKITRKIWSFFETYVTAEDNWLPPDNMQEKPVYVVAHRTSPTNIGLSLLSNLTAYDFGYISGNTFLQRTENTLRTMQRMERYQGHFYNWYDTQTLKPLYPLYVSTVDSGNLAGHLLTLGAGLHGLVDQPIFSARLFAGMRDTLALLGDAAKTAAPHAFASLAAAMPVDGHEGPATLADARAFLETLEAGIVAFRRETVGIIDQDLTGWLDCLVRQCEDITADLHQLAPWVFFTAPAHAPAGPNLDHIPTLRELASYDALMQSHIAQAEEHAEGEAKTALHNLRQEVARASLRALERISLLNELHMLSEEMARMEYGFLYDADSHLFTIGYNVQDHRADTGSYDLLASEARLTSFVAIAQGQVSQQSWFALGRQLIRTSGKPSLVSWSGSMFEYLMPLLVMPTFEKTLLDQTYQSAVRRQIEYGAQRGVLWGMSESGYNTFDAHLNYQYKAFGVPDLGIKRGLANDLVIAPYASIMALMVLPEEACQNMQRLSAEGYEGRFGLYEAVDFTSAHLQRGTKSAVIRSFMAHHQGMSFLSLSYFLLDRPMQRRFAANPLFQATMLLLHEKVPKTTIFYSKSAEHSINRSDDTAAEMPMRVLRSTKTPVPEVQLLSNGRYHVMVTSAGGSYSRWNDLALTRWQEDSTRDNWGTFCYIRDLENGQIWSNSYQPTLVKSKDYEVIFSEGRAEFRRKDGDFDMHTEIVVSPEDDIELRRVRIKNRSKKRRTIEVTTYAEVVLAPAAADNAHPAFSKLFVQTEILKKRRSIICTRRARSNTEKPNFMFHQVIAHGGDLGQISYETDRMKFLGRGNTTLAPEAIQSSSPLSGAQGSVLDPVVAIRHQITLDADETVTFDIVMGASDTRGGCLALIDKYRDQRLADRVFELAWTHSHVLLRQINASEADAQLYARLANSIVYSGSALRAEASTLIKNRRGQSGLWSYAISGDFPIVLLQIKDSSNIDLVRQLVQAHAYWRLKGLAVDLVIWNEDQAGYRQLLQEQIMGLISAGVESQVVDRPGGIFVRPGDQISPEDRILLETVARVILTDSNGSLAEQVSRSSVKDVSRPHLVPTQQPRPASAITQRLQPPKLLLGNGTGGFSEDGREYIITTGAGQRTPAPWVNVLANPVFGTVISENGSSYTWSDNAHEFRLTPWANDPVSDSGGEAFYIRDEATGEFWSPVPHPVRSDSPYITRHGFGYSVFEHVDNGIHSEMTVYVAMDAPVKFSVLKLRNDSGRSRQLSVTGYVEWVMGDLRPKTAMHVVTEIDPVTGALFARNAYNTEFAERIAFFDVDDEARTVTGDRREFIGRNKTLQSPAAMGHFRLSGKVGAGLDPCGAIQSAFTLADGEEREIIFRLGVAGKQNTDNPSLARRFAEAGSVIRRYRGSVAAHNALDAVHRYWTETLGAVRIETPDTALNTLANGWLVYQTLACRLWARSGYYQSGGAFGFRDQLQDAMALLHSKPVVLRDQLLLHATRQFLEGDVQHWWHPPLGRGVRTKCSDDFLWLPLATCRYVLSTRDTGVLDEMAHFLEGRQLNADEDSVYDHFPTSSQQASLYDHCVRAIEHGLRFGDHGLPLMGSCDWNDGMDKVGAHGKGESVWLGFFLYDILQDFSKVADIKGDTAFAKRCLEEAKKLQANIEANAWDGDWYRRAYFDDGTPLGSASNEECQIDSLSQSWSVLSGAGNPERAAKGMAAVDARLVRRDVGIVQLLDPPFDKSEQNPGYIRGYVPGVRENGGQYTHAAVWTAMAFAKMGNHERTWELLQMINPLNHARTAEEVELYKVEPYVVTADVYGQAPHAGRGGWSWYTGSSGWMYRLIVESFLGLKLDVDKLSFAPCLPPGWDGFRIDYRYRTTTYSITVKTGGDAQLTVDGKVQADAHIQLIDDQQPHSVELRLVAAAG
ncbi:MAG: glucoamylase family protein [Micavibrio sp.]|nr:glucoamylase family protein [Micavibrio sp.]